MINKIKKIIFKKFFERKILLLGRSHFLNYRPKYKSLKNISDLDYKIFSQNGEDGILNEITKRLNISENGWCCEFGAWDGIRNANTRTLFLNGWRGLYIESDETRYKELINNFEKEERI